MTTKNYIPRVSIGMPVYNGERFIREAIDSILTQTFTDFEFIISDNASTDGTEQICRSYAEKDARIKYIRQDKNTGADSFVFLYEQAVGEFFMWAPAHYSRSIDFLEENVKILEQDLKCNFSSTPNCWIGDEQENDKFSTFSFEGTVYDRISKYLDIHMQTHACFYALFRRTSIEGLNLFKNSYIAFDQVFMIKQLLNSEFKRSKDGLLSIGKGRSADYDYIATIQTRPIHYLLPFYDFSKDVSMMVMQSKNILFSEKIILIYKIFIVNMRVYKMIIRYWFVKITKKVGIYDFIRKNKK